MKVKMKNEQIYTIGHLLASSFNEIDNQYLPAKVNFLFQKNKQTMIELTKEIENARISIIKHFGVLNEETNNFDVPTDKVDEANAEILELFNIEQEVNVYKINLDELDDLKFTSQQMEALMFMIEYEEE